MAHGLPDYYRGVDIAYQALSELMVRPKYGGANILEGSLTVTGGAYNLLASVSGKGMIYGGWVWVEYTSTQAQSAVMVRVDGEFLTALGFYELNRRNISKPRTAVVILNKFDDVIFGYSAGISYGITFETTLALYYKENHATTPLVYYRLIYALI